jgi:uncharacterized radical SAM superfamily Fe-S cluster-containing enzyme
MSKLLSIPIRVAGTSAPSQIGGFEARLTTLALPLKSMTALQVAHKFELGADVTVLKTTLSLCPDCLSHVQAAVYVRDAKVLMAKHCPEHGMHHAVIENDERYYRLSNKDRWGKLYDENRIMFIPEFSGSCCGEGESCDDPVTSAWQHDFSDQRGNKSCTILVEVTDACNLACRVCYADSKGDKLLPFKTFCETVVNLIALKGSLDSVQITGGEAAVHPQFWEMLDFLYEQPKLSRIYLPTNGIVFSKPGMAAKLKKYTSKLLMLLQFDGIDKATNMALRHAKTDRIRGALLKELAKHDIPTQLTMTLAMDVNQDEIAWVVSQGVKHRNVRLVALQPTFYSGRYDLPPDPMRRLTLSDAVKGIVSGLSGKTRVDDFMPIPCSHPNCGWVTLFVRRFGLLFNTARYVDIERVMNKVAYKTQLGQNEVQHIMGTKVSGIVQRLAARFGRKLVRPRDVLGIAIKPFMDRFSYDQDRISACCHHILDTHGNLVSFCEYNARFRAQDSWARFPTLQNHTLAAEALAE